jgi:general secretion pathway protein E
MPDTLEASPAAIAPTAAALGALLVDRGALTAAALDRALRLQSESGERLSAVLTKLGLISERALAEAFAAVLNVPIVSAADFPDAPVIEDRISRKFLKQARAIPLEDRPNGLVLAMADPLDNEVADALRFALRKPVLRRAALPADIEAAYERLYAAGAAGGGSVGSAGTALGEDDTTEDIERLKDLASEAPVIRLVNGLIARAVESRASDIHIEPQPHGLRVRYRIDGVLQEVEAPPPASLRAAIVSRIKIMAKLNIAERRLAQDGRIRLPIRGREIDLRVATSPTLHGESVVLRILDRSSLALDFATLGFDDDILAPYLDVVRRPHGILLVTGPTGSGKTTTLYTSLLTLNTPDKKILTIEDPIEYQLDGINQHQVKPQIGLTFAGALRSFLRQDPDIMMVGEIRDLETAQIAVQAALTGHMILSTLHTNNAASAVTRLLDMGIDDFLLTSTINGIVGQRLVRRLCVDCRRPYRAPQDVLDRLSYGAVDALPPDPVLYHPVGCPACGGTGFLGRTMILELLVLSDAVRQLVLRRAEAGEIRRAAIAEGMTTMHQHGVRKAFAGITTVEEVVRVTREV